ncbi:MAG: flagellar hook-associated protein 3, partial [Pusillimonas sp.]|nr:flagellar hook-associated protein 3 [Pusillimonas sp.]
AESGRRFPSFQTGPNVRCAAPAPHRPPEPPGRRRRAAARRWCGGLEVAFEGVPLDGYAFSIEPVAPSTNLNVFDALDDIITALKTPVQGDPVAYANYQNVLSSSMQRIDVNFDQVQTVISSVGTRLSEIDAIDASGSVRQLSYAQDLSRLEDVDYYEAIAQLQLRTAALEAASMAFKKIQETSMFNLKG